VYFLLFEHFHAAVLRVLCDQLRVLHVIAVHKADFLAHVAQGVIVPELLKFRLFLLSGDSIYFEFCDLRVSLLLTVSSLGIDDILHWGMILSSSDADWVSSPTAIIHFLILCVINRRLSNAHTSINYSFMIDWLLVTFIDTHHLGGAVVLKGCGGLHGWLRHQGDQWVALMIVHLQVRGRTLRGEVMESLVDRCRRLHLLGLVHRRMRRIQRGEATVRMWQLLVVLNKERLLLAELRMGRGQRDTGEGWNREERRLLELRILQCLVYLTCCHWISCRQHTTCLIQIQGPLRWKVVVRAMSPSWGNN